MADASVFALYDGRLALMENRSDYVSGDHDYWVFPGGKVDAGETPTEAMEREMYEEIGCTPIEYSYLGSSVGSNGYRTHLYLVTSWGGDPPAETDRMSPLKWLDPRDFARHPEPGPTVRNWAAYQVISRCVACEAEVPDYLRKHIKGYLHAIYTNPEQRARVESTNWQEVPVILCPLHFLGLAQIALTDSRLVSAVTYE